MNGEIIAVGSELLLGQIVNSNAKYLSEQMSHIGINIYHHSVVGDNPARVEEVVEHARNRCNLVILTGGLGPTKDDLTKEAVAKVLEKNLIYDKDTEKRIEDFFKQRNRIMTENNRKQAMVLEGAKIFPNDHGLACGMAIEKDKCLFILLPGPPKELMPMVETYVIPFLRGELKEELIIQSRVLRFFDIGESQLVEVIDDLLEQQLNPTIAPLASDGEVTLRLTVKGKDQVENIHKLDELQEKIVSRLNEFYYGTGEDSLLLNLLSTLKANNLSVTSAESLTGGLFAAELTKLPGASAVFPGGFISYSNEIKKSILDVSEQTLINEGPVSHTCAKSMAMGAREKGKADFGISFTGVAGPDPLEGKPPGLVYIGIASNDKTESYELRLAGSRENIRERSVKYGAYFLLQWIRKDMEKVDE